MFNLGIIVTFSNYLLCWSSAPESVMVAWRTFVNALMSWLPAFEELCYTVFTSLI